MTDLSSVKAWLAARTAPKSADGCRCPGNSFLLGKPGEQEIVWEVTKHCPLHRGSGSMEKSQDSWPEFPSDPRYRLGREERREDWLGKKKERAAWEEEQDDDFAAASYSSKVRRNR